MTAGELVKEIGDSLVGRLVLTRPMGEYPGGVAIIKDLGHDPAAPEIVMNVDLPGWGTIGVFEYEDVELHTWTC